LEFAIHAGVLLFLLGLGVGAVGTLVGAGGGFIVAPILLLVYPKDEPQTLSAISLATVFFNALSGTIAYVRQRRIDYRSGLLFALAATPGSIIGALVVGVIPRRPFDGLMAAFLAGIACFLLWPAGAERAKSGGSPRHLVDARGAVYDYRVRTARGALYSSVVGFVSSFLGIGGGIIHVPLLVGVLGFPTHIATATSHFVLAIISGTGTITHVLNGSFANGHGLRRTVALALGVSVGAQLGARASIGVSERLIQRLLATALFLVAARLAVAALS